MFDGIGTPEIQVDTIMFSPGAVQIVYIEDRDTSEIASIQKTMIVDLSRVLEEVAEIKDVARDIIDKALLLMRNPPEKVRRAPKERDESESNPQ